LHGTALWHSARYCTVAVCTVLHCGSLHGTALWQFVRYSVLQWHYINTPYTGCHPQRGKGVYQSMHALNHSMSVTVPLFMKLSCTAQLFVISCCTEFCANRTRGQLPILQHRQSDGRTDIVISWGVNHLSFYFAKEFYERKLANIPIAKYFVVQIWQQGAVSWPH